VYLWAYLFVEAAQIAAYNAPPFPAGLPISGWHFLRI
jgi:hypothetical protein